MTVMSVIKIAGIKNTTYGFPFINKYIVPIHKAIAAVDWLAQEKYLHLIHEERLYFSQLNYGISSYKEKIITNKSVKEWELSNNETKNIFSLCTNLFSTTNTS